MSKHQIGSVSMINLFVPAPPFREGRAGKKHGLFAKETHSCREEDGDKTALNSLCRLLRKEFSNTKIGNLKLLRARVLSHYYFQQQQSVFRRFCSLSLPSPLRVPIIYGHLPPG